MLSRVADSLFWMARNCERMESNADILEVQLIKMLEASEHEILVKHDLEAIIGICGDKEEFDSLYEEITMKNVVHYLAFSEDNFNSLSRMTKNIRENAKMTRDRIPNMLWEVWNEFYLEQENAEAREDYSIQEIHSYIRRIKTTSMIATGIIDSTMSRDLPYHFIKIGKWLERAEKTALVMQMMYRQSVPYCDLEGQELDWRTSLQLINGYEDFTKKFRPLMEPKFVLQFMISDHSFPRSLCYCMEHVREVIKGLEGEKVAHYSWKMYAAIDNMISEFKDVDIKKLNTEEIGVFIDSAYSQCLEFGKLFSETYYLEADPVK
ncbi:alpha-E domain-containing protein [Peribacillus sp. NPDC097225]|uniref:alpha-E domain-containing protein n=1 Tax=Peribacillus sp. NPDC097225 TaxID=3364400 RepID=UPI0037FFF161